MNAGRVFELKPLLAAAIIGGLLFGAIGAFGKRRGWGAFMTGAAVGAAVQVGVRALKVS